MHYKLFCFDIDGTLADRDSIELYPEVLEYFRENFSSGGPAIALITNQGGPACHDAGWEFSANFPNFEEIRERLEIISGKVSEVILSPPAVFVAWAFKTRDGAVIYPQGIEDSLKDENLRKPKPGMIFQAMEIEGIDNPADILMVGDRPEDQGAARAAGVGFEWASEFFGRKNETE